MRPGSAAGSEHCRATARHLGVPCETRRLPVVPRTEGEAREARYEALEQMRAACGAGAIATGHTLDDDAETVLVRGEQGRPPFGIPAQRGRIVRPLLGMRRRDTRALCAAAGIPVLEDPSNEDDFCLRNRIRHHVLPALGDAGVVDLAGAGALARASAGARRAEAASALERVLAGSGEGEVRLDRHLLGALTPDLRAGVLREALRRLDPGLADTASRRAVAAAAGIVAGPHGRLDLPGGYVAASSAGEVVLSCPGPPVVLPEVALAVPGYTEAPAWGLAFDVAVVAPPADPRTPPAAGEAYLDAGVACQAGALLLLRARRPGDRLRPLGAPGGRKLQDVLVDRKVPRDLRDRVPLLLCGDRLAWVVGHCLDEAVKITPASRGALRIRVTQVAGPARPRVLQSA